MSGLTNYIIKQILVPWVVFTLLLTGVIWLTQSLRLLDVILTKGQQAATFLSFAVLALPSVMALVLPVAFFAAVLYALNRMHGDHELVVLSATGLSSLGIARPVMSLAGMTGCLVLVFNAALMPAANTALKGQVLEIRADLATSLLREGAFSNPIPGLTVYIRGRNSSGDMLGILVHDNRDMENPITYMAETGTLVKAGAAPRLILVNGNLQRRSPETGNLSLLYFDRYVYDLSEFMPEQGVRWKEPEERYLDELFFPVPPETNQSQAAKLRTEGHKRLSAPLYPLAFGMIAVFALLTAQYSRRQHFWRLGAAVAAGVVVRLSGLGMENIAQHNFWVIPLLYLWPLLVMAACLYLLSGNGARLRYSLGRALRTAGGAATGTP